MDGAAGTAERGVVLAVDGGGTKTHCAVGDGEGRLLGQGFGGPSNHQVVGPGRTREALKAAVSSALADAAASLGAAPGRLTVGYAYLGMAGADFPEDLEILRPLAAAILGSAPFEIVNDAWIALLGGCPEGWGAALICGTGTNAVARSPEGRTATLRSQDYRLGNYGGGPHLAEQALHRAFRGDEGTGAWTRLQEELPRLLGTGDMEGLFRRLFGRPEEPSKEELDRIPPLVFRLAEEGDGVCRDLLANMGAEVGAMAAGVCVRSGLADREFTLVLAGSLFEKPTNPLFADSAAARVRAVAPGVRPVLPSGPPVFGALAEAARRLRGLRGL